MRLPPLLLAVLPVLLPACGDRFSPDTYATRAVQQADKVEQGIIVGVRRVRISADGTVGAATGAAAGGALGAQASGSGIVQALGGVSGALVGGLIGQGAEHTVVDTNAFEYIVRTHRNELLRVTQQDGEPLLRGQAVLVITGSQARVVPDYTLTPEIAAASGGSATQPGGRGTAATPGAGATGQAGEATPGDAAKPAVGGGAGGEAPAASAPPGPGAAASPASSGDAALAAALAGSGISRPASGTTTGAGLAEAGAGALATSLATPLGGEAAAAQR